MNKQHKSKIDKTHLALSIWPIIVRIDWRIELIQDPELSGISHEFVMQMH